MVIALSDFLKNAPAAPHPRRDDPLHLNLPPLPGGDVISSQTLRALGAMYLQAELEQAGVIFVVEVLSDAVEHLNLMSATAARKLDEFGRRRRDWYDRPRRDAIFGRVFGLGHSAGIPGEINNDFQSIFANFCNALVRYANGFDWSTRPNVGDDVRVRQSAMAVVMNLTIRQYGNTLLAARLIGEQLRIAIDVLSDPGISAHFGTRGLWDTLRKILGSQAPDIDRLITRGESGMHLLDWIAGKLPDVANAEPAAPLAKPNDNAFLYAEQWLDATGLGPDLRRSAI
jgi:hypothetical protein